MYIIVLHLRRTYLLLANESVVRFYGGEGVNQLINCPYMVYA